MSRDFKSFLRIFLLSILAAASLSACSGQLTAPTATATTVPTATPEPTATPAPLPAGVFAGEYTELVELFSSYADEINLVDQLKTSMATLTESNAIVINDGKGNFEALLFSEDSYFGRIGSLVGQQLLDQPLPVGSVELEGQTVSYGMIDQNNQYLPFMTRGKKDGKEGWLVSKLNGEQVFQPDTADFSPAKKVFAKTIPVYTAEDGKTYPSIDGIAQTPKGNFTYKDGQWLDTQSLKRHTLETTNIAKVQTALNLDPSIEYTIDTNNFCLINSVDKTCAAKVGDNGEWRLATDYEKWEVKIPADAIIKMSSEDLSDNQCHPAGLLKHSQCRWISGAAYLGTRKDDEGITFVVFGGFNQKKKLVFETPIDFGIDNSKLPHSIIPLSTAKRSSTTRRPYYNLISFKNIDKYIENIPKNARLYHVVAYLDKEEDVTKRKTGCTEYLCYDVDYQFFDFFDKNKEVLSSNVKSIISGETENRVYTIMGHIPIFIQE